MRQTIADVLDNVDAVVLSLPPEDTAFGWDYPALRRLFEARSVPHTCLFGDPDQPLSDSDGARLDALMIAVGEKVEARHG
jgi:hypothetical protein